MAGGYRHYKKLLEDTDTIQMTWAYRHYKNDEDTDIIKMTGEYTHYKMTRI